MPRILKRRADAISRSPSRSPSPATPQPSQRRQRRSSPPLPPRTPAAAENSNTNDSEVEPPSDEDTQFNPESQHKTLVKQLVRLALACEYTRQPLRRSEIQTRIFKSGNTTSTTGTGTGTGPGTGPSRGNFRQVFSDAQTTLRDVFGMELVDLPLRSAGTVSLADRRKAASQRANTQGTQATQPQRGRRSGNNVETGHSVRRETQTQPSANRQRDALSSAQTWMLVSTLPARYRAPAAGILRPNRAPSTDEEAVYTGLYTLVISLIYLNSLPVDGAGSASASHSSSHNNNVSQNDGNDEILPLSDSKLLRYLSRLNLESWTPMHGVTGGTSLEKFLARMVREGYLEKRRDGSSGEEVVEWFVGPRGRREVGREGVAGLVAGVYGHGLGRGYMPRSTGGEDADENENEGDGRRVVKMEKEELERRLRRTLGEGVRFDLGTDGSGVDDRGGGADREDNNEEGDGEEAEEGDGDGDGDEGE